MAERQTNRQNKRRRGVAPWDQPAIDRLMKKMEGCNHVGTVLPSPEPDGNAYCWRCGQQFLNL